jgi:MFS family permease
LFDAHRTYLYDRDQTIAGRGVAGQLANGRSPLVQKPVSQLSHPLADATGRLSRRAWGTLLVLCGALFLDALDVSMIGVALPSIRTDLDMSTSSLQWIVSAYVLGYGGFLLLGGRAADLLGRRRVFLISLGVFVVASAIGGFANDGSLLIATRFIKGVSAAFTAPAGLSIITTSFLEGPARNKALAVYTATGATGFSLGLVFGGLLTEIGWRWVFFLPAPVALAAMLAGLRLVPRGERPARAARSFDVPGAVTLTGAMLLLVYTLVEAPHAGWASGRTLASFAGALALFVAFVVRERSTATPLVRLGILRSAPLVRANLAAISLFGSWVGFQFIATLYMQQLRGWSALETGLAIFPGGFLVAVFSPRIAPLVMRFGVQRLIVGGMLAISAGYALFLPIGLDSSYQWAVLPTVLLAGVGFALAFGPLNIAATTGVAAEEQGLAGGLLNTSFQFGGALFLAVVAAVVNANTTGATPEAILDGYHAGLVVPVIAGVLGILAMATGLRLRARSTAAEPEPDFDAVVVEEAA